MMSRDCKNGKELSSVQTLGLLGKVEGLYSVKGYKFILWNTLFCFSKF